VILLLGLLGRYVHLASSCPAINAFAAAQLRRSMELEQFPQGDPPAQDINASQFQRLKKHKSLGRLVRSHVASEQYGL
jgi:hypothetical protein